MPKPRALRLYQTEFRAMGSPCRFNIYAADPEQAASSLAAARARIQRLEQKYSRYQADTITSRINTAAGTGEWVALDTETHQLLCLAQRGYQLSDGRFDITSGVLRQVWDFKRGRLPDADALASVLPLIGWSQVEMKMVDGGGGDHVAQQAIDDPDADSGWVLYLPKTGMEIDFGGLVKEYAADAAAKAMREQGVVHGFIDLGGDLSVIGPHPEQGAWPIGVRDPHTPTRPISRLQVWAGAVATSGDYERYFERNGRRYCHILDPRTGWPVFGFASVTVVTEPCVVAGIAATVAMLKGVREGLEWLKGLGVPFFAVTAPVTDPDTGATKARQIVTEHSTAPELERVLSMASDCY